MKTPIEQAQQNLEALQTEEFLQQYINSACDTADRTGSATISTCNHSGWDPRIWTHRNQIMDTIRKRGYEVSSSVKWGVLDITIAKKLNLS